MRKKYQAYLEKTQPVDTTGSRSLAFFERMEQDKSEREFKQRVRQEIGTRNRQETSQGQRVIEELNHKLVQ